MVGNVTTQEHIGAMLWTSGPAVVIALVGFALLGLLTPPSGSAFDPSTVQDVLASEFSISLINLLPLVFLIILSLRRAPPFLAIFASALFAAVMAVFTQPAAVEAFVGDTSKGPVGTALAGDLRRAGDGLRVEHRQRDDRRALLPRRHGVDAEHDLAGAGRPVLRRDHGGRRLPGAPGPPHRDQRQVDGRLIASVIGTCIGLNIIAGDQYVAIVMPSRVYRFEFARRGIAPRMLSRAVEDSGTVTSPLVPWNSCGAYMAGVLGVATVAYLPFCFFNLLSPVISLFYGFTGINIEHIEPAAERARPQGQRPQPG